MVTRQGILKAGQSTVFSAENKKNYVNRLISLNNSVAYNIEIQKYDSTEDNTVTLCKLSLAAGDTVLNTSPYPLNAKDRLILSSSATDTSYLVSLEEVK